MATEIANRIMGWTQLPEPALSQQEIVEYPIHSEEAIYLTDFLELLSSTYCGAFHYYAQEDQLQPIQTVDELPTDRSFLVQHTYYVPQPKRLCVERVQARGAWNQSCLVTTTTEHTGYLMFYLNTVHDTYDEYTCIYTYYDGTSQQHRRYVFKKDHIIATDADWEALVRHGNVWINPAPIQAQFPLSDPNVLEKTRRHRIPIIAAEEETREPMIYIS